MSGNDVNSALQALVQAAEAKREAELAVQAMLSSLRGAFNGLREELTELRGSIGKLEETVRQTTIGYARVEAKLDLLVSYLAADSKERQGELIELQQRLQQLALRPAALPGTGPLSPSGAVIEIQGDVAIGGDMAGGDKTTSKRDKASKGDKVD